MRVWLFFKLLFFLVYDMSICLLYVFVCYVIIDKDLNYWVLYLFGNFRSMSFLEYDLLEYFVMLM